MSKIVVSQLGARMHYAVPRILAANGRLAHFYTDICATKGWPRLLDQIPAGLLPNAVKRLIGRRPTGIPMNRVTAFSSFGLHSAVRRLAGRGPETETRNAIWAGRGFSERVARAGFHGAAGLYAFSGDALEQLAAAKAAGLFTVLEQMIAPRDVVEQLLAEEQQRFPQWEDRAAKNPFAVAFADRERGEWALADLILCPSDFVRSTLIASGADPARCALVPYGVDARFAVPDRRHRDGPIRILTVGQVGLRKGSPYVVEAARRLGPSTTVRMVGSSHLSPAVRSRIAEAVELTGPIPRSEMREQFAWADVFLLPSLCEGSATATYEALGAGLPVITTENTGSVVRDGIEGFIVPIRDPSAIVEAAHRLADPDLRRRMSEAAVSRAADFTVERYGARLLAALATVPGQPLSASPSRESRLRDEETL